MLAAWKAEPGLPCNIRNAILCFTLGFPALLHLYRPPFLAAFDNILTGTMMMMMFMAVLFISISILANGEPKNVMDFLVARSADLLLVSAVLMMIKAAYDILVYSSDIYLSRRKKAAISHEEAQSGLIAMEEYKGDVQRIYKPPRSKPPESGPDSQLQDLSDLSASVKRNQSGRGLPAPLSMASSELRNCRNDSRGSGKFQGVHGTINAGSTSTPGCVHLIASSEGLPGSGEDGISAGGSYDLFTAADGETPALGSTMPGSSDQLAASIPQSPGLGNESGMTGVEGPLSPSCRTSSPRSRRRRVPRIPTSSP